MNLSAFGSDLSWWAAKSSSSTIICSANNDTHRKNRVFNPWTHITYHFDFQLHPTWLYSPTQSPLRLRAREKCDLNPFNHKVTQYEPKISQCACIYHDMRIAARVPIPWVKVDAKIQKDQSSFCKIPSHHPLKNSLMHWFVQKFWSNL